MNKVLVCQHVGYEILGTLNPLFKSEGFRLRYVNFGRFPQEQPRMKGYNGLVLLGGPMNVDQIEHHPHLQHEVDMIREAVDLGMPVLGICLGSQLIARALGAEVKPNPKKEIGWHEVRLTEAGTSDPVLRHFQASERIFHWHGDTFDIPAGATHLAESAGCRNQAFRFGEKIYGLQFHLEVDEPLIERWLQVPRYQEELKPLSAETNAEKILQETRAFVERSKQLSRQTFGEFLRLFGPKKRFRCLTSR
jgi:GMP synthase - Glutamine amidotransferase domain